MLALKKRKVHADRFIVGQSIFWILLALENDFVGQLAEAREVKCRAGDILESSENKVFNAEISDPIGFCSNHASRDLLHQEICKRAKDPKQCFQPAIADFLTIDAQTSNERRNSNYALMEILRRQTVANEECLKSETLFPPITQKFRTFEAKFTKMGSVLALKECRVLGKSKSECTQDIKSPLFTEYLYAGIRRWRNSQDCSPKPIPRLHLDSIEIRKAGLSSSEILNENLKSGRSVKVAIKGPHALVISNYRIICKNSRPTLQYQVLDSLYGTQWSQAKKIGDWIDGTTLINELEPTSNFWIVRLNDEPTTTTDSKLDTSSGGSPTHR